jgi:hypothetical protein
MTGNNQAYERAMALAALSGLKIALGPALLATSRRWPTRQNWVIGALGEMFLDKVGIFPPRYRPALLLPHTLAGAWVAHESMKEDGIDDPMAAVMGAVVAAGVAAVAPMARIAGHKVLGVPDMVLGVAEDFLALKYGTQAVGVSMDELTDAASESVNERIVPALQSVGATVNEWRQGGE